MKLSARERRAIMLETQTPAYARSSEARRAIDLHYKRAKSLRAALPHGVKVTTRAIVPHQHEHVSGLNVPSNFITLVGDKAISRFGTMQGKARRALVKRNDASIPRSLL